jgi:hypothetical protein
LAGPFYPRFSCVAGPVKAGFCPVGVQLWKGDEKWLFPIKLRQPSGDLEGRFFQTGCFSIAG